MVNIIDSEYETFYKTLRWQACVSLLGLGVASIFCLIAMVYMYLTSNPWAIMLCALVLCGVRIHYNICDYVVARKKLESRNWLTSF